MAKNSSKNSGKDNLTPFEPGQSGNPNGRPKGQRNYATIYREALAKIAKTQNMTPEEIEEVMLQSGLKKAIKGDYAFYRDTLDRLHGKPMQKTDVTSGGEKIVFLPPQVLNKLDESTQETD